MVRGWVREGLLSIGVGIYDPLCSVSVTTRRTLSILCSRFSRSSSNNNPVFRCMFMISGQQKLCASSFMDFSDADQPRLPFPLS